MPPSVSTDRDAWIRLIGTLQATVREQATGVGVITLRIGVQNGLLIGWCDPTARRWNSTAETWLDGQGVKPFLAEGP